MSMNESQITSIEASIKALMATGHPLVPGLRNLFPDITFVRCSARDIGYALPYQQQISALPVRPQRSVYPPD